MMGDGAMTLLGDLHMAISMMPLLGVVLILAGVMLMLRKRRHRQHTGLTAREQLERLKQREKTRGELGHLMVEIEQMAKRIGAQLDAKTIQIEQLLNRAETKISELKRWQGQAVDGLAANGADATREADQERGGSGSGEAAAGMGVGTGAKPMEREAFNDDDEDAAAGTAGQGGETQDPLMRSVYQLSDAGLEAADIAGKLNEHIGKVELILALRQS